MTNVTGTGPTTGGETPVESAAPKLLYWHVWTDDLGATHQTRCELSAFHMQSMGGRAAPQWNDHLVTADATVLIASLPVGCIGEWHGNPKPQWIVPLSGCWFVETTEGRASRWDPARSPSAATRTRSPTAPDGGGIARAPSATRRPF